MSRMNAMKVGLERVGAVLGTLLLAFALLLVNSPARAASYVATDASSATSSVVTTGLLGHAKSGNSWAPGFNPQGFKMPGLLKRARV